MTARHISHVISAKFNGSVINNKVKLQDGRWRVEQCCNSLNANVKIHGATLSHRTLRKIRNDAYRHIKAFKKLLNGKSDSHHRFEWHKRFSEGDAVVNDRKRSGRPSASGKINNQIKEYFSSDRRRTVQEVADMVNTSGGKAYSIVTQDLNQRKMCARRVEASEAFLQRYRSRDNASLTG